MKKVLSLLLSFLFITTSVQARDVMVVGADGKPKDEMGITREPAINDDRILIDDFEDGNLKNRLEGDGGAWNKDPNEEDTFCRPEIVPMLAPELSENVLKLSYDVSSETLDPAQNGFWMKLMNVDATAYDHLEFFIRGDREAGFTTKFKIEVKKYKDEKRVDKYTAYEVIEGVTESWKRIQIPLTKLNAIEKWKDLDEFVIVFDERICDVKEGTLYFDNIRFVKTGHPGLTIYDGRGSKIRKTYNEYNAKEWGQWLASRLRDYPEETDPVFVEKEFPKDDREFLMEVARDTWRFFDQVVDKKSHLPLDTIAFAEDGIFGEGAYVGDYTNVTNIGMYLVCLVAAADLEFITKEEAIKRTLDTLRSVERMESYENFLFNYYDTTTMERTDNLVSLIDSGWLTIGVLMGKLAFPEEKEVVSLADRLLAKWDFSFFYDSIEKLFFHGYYTNIGGHKDYHYGPLYSEPRIVSYLAVARGDVPEEHWFALNRTFQEDYGWQTQTPIGRTKKEHNGISYYGGYYEHNGVKYVPSWGGSLFEALMPALFLNEKDLAPDSLGINNKVHAEQQAKYTLEELGYPVWGMSPSTVPEGGYSEFGVKFLGSKGYKPGVVTPHASILAIEYIPEQVIANMRALIKNYKIYGPYGFYDSVNPETKKVALKYLSLDQGMIFLALTNYLKDGVIRKRFHTDPQMKAAEYLLTGEKLFE